MASPIGYTNLGAADFYRFAAGVVPLQYAAFLGPGDISYNTGTPGQTANDKFINLWNSGSPTVLISGPNDPGDGIARLGNYNLLASSYMTVTYAPTPPDPTPLTSTPPIQLTSIQNAFGPSLEGARVSAGFGSPVSMLDFLGAAPPVFPDIERQVVDPGFIGGFSWSTSGSYASTGLGDTIVSPVSFSFGAGAPGGSPIPEDVFIDTITLRIFVGAVTGDRNLLAAARWWFEDPNFTSFLE